MRRSFLLLPLLLLLLVRISAGRAQLQSTGTADSSLPSLPSSSPSTVSPSLATPSPLSSLGPLANLTSLLLPTPSGSASSSSSSSSFSLFGSSPYSGQYSSRLSLMSSSIPSLWRLELRLPSSVSSSVLLVEVHLLLELDGDQSFVQPAATTAANGVNSSVGSAVYTPITNSQQLVPLFPANNVALNYSSTASVGETILAALFSASPTTNVQLNYVMRQQPDVGHFWIDYIALQPQLNQSLWYYFTIHSGVSGLDTNWQHITEHDGLSYLPSTPLVEMTDPTTPQLLDVSSLAGTILAEAGFVWETAVISSASTAANSSPPPAPEQSSASSAAVSQYRIALVTNSSTLLWANAAWRIDGGRVQRSSMSPSSATQFLGPPLTLQSGDVLTYQLSWWDLSSNAEQSSPLTFLYRPATADALQLTETAASGSSTLPGGTNLGDGQSVWSKLKQSVQSSLARLPAAPTVPGLGAPSLTSSPASSSATASVVGAVSSGLATLLSSLSALQSSSAQVIHGGGQSSVSVSEQPAATSTSATHGGNTASIQSLTDLITPLALIGSLASLSSPPGSSSLSSMSTYAGAAFCVLPCATSSPNSDVMVSCLGGCAQPFLPAGLSSSEASSVINALHDYIVSSAQQAAITTPSSVIALNQTTVDNGTLVELSGNNTSSGPGPTAGNSSTTVSPSASLTPSSNSVSQSSGQSSPRSSQTGSVPSILPQSAASSILTWLTGTQSTASPSSLSSIPSLLPAPARASSGPGAALASSLSSGLGYLSSPLLAGLSSLSTGQVSIASNSHSPTGGLTLTSFGQSVTLPLSVLSALLTPLLPPGASPAAVASTTTYVAGLTCMLPCIGGSVPTAAVSTTSSCIGSCIDAVMPGTGTGGAKLVNDIDSIMQPAARLTPAFPSASSTATSHSVSTPPLSSTAAAASGDSAQPSSTAVVSAAAASSPVLSASPTLSLIGSASGVAASLSPSAQSSSAQRVTADGAAV